jgi:hypothetical protein
VLLSGVMLVLLLLVVLPRRLLAVTLLLLLLVVLGFKGGAAVEAADAAAAAANAVPFAASCSRFIVLYFDARLAAWRSPTSLRSSTTDQSCNDE